MHYSPILRHKIAVADFFNRTTIALVIATVSNPNIQLTRDVIVGRDKGDIACVGTIGNMWDASALRIVSYCRIANIIR